MNSESGNSQAQPSSARPAIMPSVPPPAAAKPRALLGPIGGVFLLFFGVVLPAATVVIELVSGWCASMLFDPIPSLVHVGLIASVPVINLATMVALRRRRGEYARWMGWANGFALGVAGFYALMFLPVTPFAVIGIIFFGAGLLPLSPLTSLVCAIILCFRLRRLADGEIPSHAPGRWTGIGLAVLVLVAMEVPKAITCVGLQMAASSEPGAEIRGLRLLRFGGSRDMLLRACYVRQQGVMGDPIQFFFNEFGSRVSEDQTRSIYYRVTGTPFNMMKPPSLRGARGDVFFDDWDFGTGGDQVQGRLRGLSLSDSRQDTVVDPDSCTAYTEWTLVFKNQSARQQEARAQVALPPGAVVSRLTLWIDGQEREAAFGGRSQVREAYQKVVTRRRDPVLVTTSGPDQVLVQCFPVPPGGGTMKIRLGVTGPLDLDSRTAGLLRLPFFVERNFEIPEQLGHGVWVESRNRLSTKHTALTVSQESQQAFTVRGTVQGAGLDEPIAVGVERDAEQVEAWVSDTRGGDAAVVRQVLVEKPVDAPRRVVIVVDGSRRMHPFANSIADALKTLPAGVELAVLLASDEVVELAAVGPADDRTVRSAAEAIRQASYVGGCNNAPALAKAWDLAAASGNSVILWLHATQPVDLSGVEALRQRWERRPGKPLLFSAQFGGGPDLIVQRLDDLQCVRRIGRSDSPVDDVRHAIKLWSDGATVPAYERSRVVGATPPAGKDGSFHVARLWAYDEILRLAGSRTVADRGQALKLAGAYQLVTPVSGAVVLETQQQFDEAGLNPVSPDSVPTVPEPETWMLIIVGLLLLVAARLIRRRKHAGA
jgi:hypothetical protein